MSVVDPVVSDDVAALRAEVELLRSARAEPATDLMAEIAALRAEIDTLRAENDFARAAPTVDPEALKDCFTLIEERLSTLEFRVTEQDTALRRVLTMLVEWVEREERIGNAPHSAAA
jgi:hypothetical protein